MRPIFLGIARVGVPVILAFLFTATGIWKLLTRREFERHIAEFGLVDDRWVGFTAVFLASVEVVAGLLLILRPRQGIALSAVLLVSFSAVLAYGLARGFDVDCGCLPDPGIGLPTSLSFALGRNLFLLAALGLSWFARTREGHPRPDAGRSVS